MAAKTWRVASVWILLAMAAWLPVRANAALRVPQVPVLGGGLQAFLDSHDGYIHVGSDQNAIQRWGSTSSPNATFTFDIELGLKSPGLAVGLYNAGDTAPALYQLFPPEAVTGWFAVAAFRFSPTRVVVNVFDENAVIRGTTSYPGANKDDFSFYVAGADGIFYMQDVRNSGGAPQVLTFAGTGLNTGGWWLGFEASSVAGGESDQDFDDAVLFVEFPSCACPTQKCSWGTLKSRFR